MAKEIRTTPAKSKRTSRRDVAAINSAFLSMGFVGDGQADGPYPGMYERWSSAHLYNWPGSLGQLEQTALLEVNTA